MAWKKQTGTKHNDSCKMAYGKPSLHLNCPRCEELKNGAAPREGWNKNVAIVSSLRDRYCFSLAPWQGTCNMQTNPACNCGKSAYTD